MQVETVDPLDDHEEMSFLFGNDTMSDNSKMDVDEMGGRRWNLESGIFKISLFRMGHDTPDFATSPTRQ